MHYTIFLLLFLIIFFIYNIYYINLDNIQTKNKSIDLVISRYNENLDWINNININNFRNIIIYNKGKNINNNYISNKFKIINLSNVGRCDHTYLYHIINNYNNLADVTIFLPGSCNSPLKWNQTIKTINDTIKTRNSVFYASYVNDIRKKYADFQLDNWKASDPSNALENPEENLEKSKERPFINWYDKNFSKDIKIENSVFYGIFSVSKKHIHNRSLQSYKKLIKYLDYHSNPEAGHYFERSWLAIFHPIEKSCIKSVNNQELYYKYIILLILLYLFLLL
jgi:hypothetical protein